MPIYEWECLKCFIKEERLVSGFKPEATVLICDKCFVYMDRVLSAASLQFKGKGFYATEHKKSNNS